MTTELRKHGRRVNEWLQRAGRQIEQIFPASSHLSPEIQELRMVKKTLAKMALMTFMTSCDESCVC